MGLPRMRSPRGSTRRRVALWTALATGWILPSVGCQVEYAGMTLPSGRYMHDDVQYFPSGPDFPWANTQAATQRARMRAMGIEPPPPVGTAGVAPGTLESGSTSDRSGWNPDRCQRSAAGDASGCRSAAAGACWSPAFARRRARSASARCSTWPAVTPIDSAVTPQSDTLQHDEMARPTRHVEGIRPDQNPADDPLDGVKPGVLISSCCFFIWLVRSEQQTSETSRLTPPTVPGR